MIEEAGIKLAVLSRTITQEQEHAQNTVTNSSADKTIIIARSYCGSTTVLPDPVLTSATLTLIEKQAKQLADHHITLRPATTTTATATNQED